MKNPISQSEFERVFKIGSKQYAAFSEKILKEMKRILHPTAIVEKLEFSNIWKDSSGNVHTAVGGNVIGIAETGRIAGEIVWLNRLAKFRGKMWTSVANPSDLELVTKARESFRRSDFAAAAAYLERIQSIESLSRAQQRFKQLVDRRIASS